MAKLHILFLPLMAHGHMIPTLDMAKLFTSLGHRTTIISTLEFAQPTAELQDSGIDIGLTIVDFPPLSDLHTTSDDDTVPQLFKALPLLQEPVEKLIQEIHPDCLISDMFFPWTVHSAAKFGIPRLVFHGTSYLALCASEQMKRHKPYKNVSDDSEPFVVPNLPHQLEFVRTQVSRFELKGKENYFSKLIEQVREADHRSYGVVVNTFYELEPDYADHYRNFLGRKAWNIGPLLLHNNRVDEAKAERGKQPSIHADKVLSWLDSKNPNSVVYLCFGSLATFTPPQLHEIARGLESSGHNFIWVVKDSSNKEDNREGILPRDFMERTKDIGLIVREWAPQVAILGHPSVGAFVTHCGWNSTLEGVCAGVPMVTWPLFAEQFFNEKLVTDMLRIGVAVGSKKWQECGNEGVSGEALARALEVVMVGESAVEMRNRGKYYEVMARKAVEEGGSSYNDLNGLIQELDSLHSKKISTM